MCIFCNVKSLGCPEISFELFSESNPIIYIPFVVDMFLKLSIGQALNIHDEKYEKNRRIETLPYITLKSIQVIVNICLGLNVELSRNVIDEVLNEIRKNGIDKENRNKYSKYFRIETYITDSQDKELIIDTYRRLFNDDSLVSTEKLILCKEYVETLNINGQLLWGPPYWNVLHFTALKLDKIEERNSFFTVMVENFACLFGIMDLLLPCSICSDHYTSKEQLENEILIRPFNITAPIQILLHALSNNIFTYTSHLHDICNPVKEDMSSFEIKSYERRYSKFI